MLFLDTEADTLIPTSDWRNHPRRSLLMFQSITQEDTTMTDYQAIMIVENGQDNQEVTIEAWQHLIDTGLAWQLQGWFGRSAQMLIDQGICSA